MNTGRDNKSTDEIEIAYQTILHDEGHPKLETGMRATASQVAGVRSAARCAKPWPPRLLRAGYALFPTISFAL